jgi:hypothetical protein
MTRDRDGETSFAYMHICRDYGQPLLQLLFDRAVRLRIPALALEDQVRGLACGPLIWYRPTSRLVHMRPSREGGFFELPSLRLMVLILSLIHPSPPFFAFNEARLCAGSALLSLDRASYALLTSPYSTQHTRVLPRRLKRDVLQTLELGQLELTGNCFTMALLFESRKR